MSSTMTAGAGVRVKITKKKALEIINAVKSCPLLWNTEHADHNNRFATAVAWRNLSVSLGMPESVLRSKWRNLRDAYKKEIKKYKVKNVEEYTGKWKFFNALTFVNTEYEFEENAKDRRNSVEFVMADEFTNHDYDEDTNANEEEPAQSNSNSTIENYDVLFLKSLVPYFQKLDPVRKLIMRNRIQDLLINELALQQNNSSSKKCKRDRK
ncbi:hypothetical protein evm_005347 [Chilo suppressalis]|nr:hypothetical protein evm_005347 [Chilo suppressalis]